MKDREHRWERECCLVFPFGTDLRFLMDLGLYFRISKDLTSLMDDSGDFETSIGLLRHSNRPKA